MLRGLIFHLVSLTRSLISRKVKLTYFWCTLRPRPVQSNYPLRQTHITSLQPEGEDLTMIYRPLFWTAYWCEDWLHSSNYRGGVSGVVISSASAKTAFCLAYLIGKRVGVGEGNAGDESSRSDIRAKYGIYKGAWVV
jgi:hypothetical protein